MVCWRRSAVCAWRRFSSLTASAMALHVDWTRAPHGPERFDTAKDKEAPPRSSWRTVVLFSERRKRRSSNSFTRVKNERHYRSRVRQRQCGPSERGKKISYHQVGAPAAANFCITPNQSLASPCLSFTARCGLVLGHRFGRFVQVWRICAGHASSTF